VMSAWRQTRDQRARRSGRRQDDASKNASVRDNFKCHEEARRPGSTRPSTMPRQRGLTSAYSWPAALPPTWRISSTRSKAPAITTRGQRADDRHASSTSVQHRRVAVIGCCKGVIWNN